MSNIVELPIVTTIDRQPNRLLNAAVDQLKEVVIIGFDKEGKEYFVSSKSDVGDILYHLERAKYKLLKLVDDLS